MARRVSEKENALQIIASLKADVAGLQRAQTHQKDVILGQESQLTKLRLELREEIEKLQGEREVRRVLFLALRDTQKYRTLPLNREDIDA